MIKALFRTWSTPYRIRNGWGLDCIRNGREAKALYDFCKNWLLEREGTQEYKLNLDRAAIFETTMALYDMEFADWDDLVELRLFPCNCPEHKNSDHLYHSFYEYVNDHCGWYWS